MSVKLVKKPVGRPKKTSTMPRVKNASSRAAATSNTSTSTSVTDSKISPITGKPVRKYTKKNEKKSSVVVVKPHAKKSVSKTIFEKRLDAKKSLGESKPKKVVVKAQERVFDKVTGFAVGTDQHIIAEALMEGGETRGDIVESLREKLNPLTRSGTEKPIPNLVSSVYNKLALSGFRLESHFQLLPPTTASKRKATRLANLNK